MLLSSRVSPTNPDLLEIVERSLFPIGTEWSEFLRIRHETIGGKATNPYDPAASSSRPRETANASAAKGLPPARPSRPGRAGAARG